MTRTDFEADLAKKMFKSAVMKNGALNVNMLIDVVAELLSRMIYAESNYEINERNILSLVHSLKRIGVMDGVEFLDTDGNVKKYD